MIHLPRLTRYTLAMKIDNKFTDAIDLALAQPLTEIGKMIGGWIRDLHARNATRPML